MLGRDLATLVTALPSEMLGIKTRLTESEARHDSLQETIVWERLAKSDIR